MQPPGRPALKEWRFEVAGVEDVTPRLRRIAFGGDLAGFEHTPGQDMVLMIDTGEGPGRRHYTIRRVEAGRVVIDFVMHGHGGPAERWAADAKSGDALTALGPRGRTLVLRPEADWHLFTGDETCLPGIAAVIETLPAGVRVFAFIEVEDKDDRQEIAGAASLDLQWIVRGGPAVPSSPALIERLALFAPPPGRGHCYIVGETSTVQQQRRGLIARGMDKARISAEGYWRPGRKGGHDHIRDPE
ncbi:MAG: siderophore-interacting protein [Caulobacteraceae bacterium]|nr:siderophore-interacting protein [Caulobacteraceae bacterium]